MIKDTITKKIPIFVIICMLVISCMQITGNAESPHLVNIKVSHKITGMESSDEFNFIIEKASDESPLPEETTKTIKGEGETSFDIPVTRDGKFDYTIREIEGGNPNIKYDETLYTITILAKTENGQITTSVVIEDGSEVKPEEIVFNDYSNSFASITPIIKKEIKNDKNYNDKFSFKLEGENVSQTVSIKGAGTTSMKELEFTKAGTYEYKVFEIKSDSSDWKYDKTVYEYKITVEEKDGKLEAKANYENLTFKNEPTLLKKTKRLVSVVTGDEDDDNKGGGGGTNRTNARTGDYNKYMRLACIVAIASLVALIIARRRKNKVD